jgi:tetratricopeptide (TPR) repeat protein/CBS domain-containing protein
MIFEVTRDYTIIVPLMISNLISYFISSRLQRTPIYEALLEQDGIRLPPAARDREEFLVVGQAARPASEILDGAEPIAQAVSRVSGNETDWPVIEGSALLGMVSDAQLEMAIAAGHEREPVSALLSGSNGETALEFPHIYVDDPLDTAMRRMAQHGLKTLPVVSRTDVRELRAVVSMRDILSAYGLEGSRPAAPEISGAENRTTVKALVGTLAAVVLAIGLAAFLTTFYRSERIARAQQNFKEGNALMDKDHFEEAIEKFRSAVSISHTPEHRLALAQALLKAGHFSEAQIYFSELLGEHPTSGPANLGLARIDAAQGNIDESVRAYHRAIYGSWPGDAAAHRLEARLELIDALGKAGRRDLVQAELLSLKSEMPPDPAVRRRVGHLFLTYGMPAESIAIFRDLLKANKNDAESYAALGEAELALDDLPAAQAAFHSAARREPENPSYQSRAEFLDQIISMDPALRGLDSAQRYRHSRNLLDAALAASDRCRAAIAALTLDPARDAVEKARRALQRPAKPRSYNEAAEANIELARQLWKERAKSCGPLGPPEQALGRVMAELSH